MVRHNYRPSFHQVQGRSFPGKKGNLSSYVMNTTPIYQLYFNEPLRISDQCDFILLTTVDLGIQNNSNTISGM
jgi:hypothetical protein